MKLFDIALAAALSLQTPPDGTYTDTRIPRIPIPEQRNVTYFLAKRREDGLEEITLEALKPDYEREQKLRIDPVYVDNRRVHRRAPTRSWHQSNSLEKYKN